MQVASSGAQAASVGGRIYMCYQVDLATPKLTPGAPVGGIAHFSSIAATTANNFAAAALQSGATLSGLTLSTNTITWGAGLAGNYLCTLTVAGATSASALGVASATVTALNILSQSAVRDATDVVDSLAGTTVSPAISVFTVTVPNAGGNWVITPSTITGTGTMDLFIVALPSSVLTVSEREQAEIGVLESSVSSLMARLARLEGILSPEEVRTPFPDDSGGSGLDSSVHISQSMAARLATALRINSKA